MDNNITVLNEDLNFLNRSYSVYADAKLLGNAYSGQSCVAAVGDGKVVFLFEAQPRIGFKKCVELDIKQDYQYTIHLKRKSNLWTDLLAMAALVITVSAWSVLPVALLIFLIVASAAGSILFMLINVSVTEEANVVDALRFTS